MTYEEIKQRLTKCEVKLQEFQSKNYPGRKSKNYDTAVEKLALLKESLQKQLKEAEETMVVKTKGGDTEIVGMDRKQAQSLKTDPSVTSIKTSKGQKIKEQDGVQFSKEETAAIAKEVGKAVAKALHGLGDEVAHMKAKDLEPNSFEIYVQYKNNSDDQFSFYISDDTLHLQDFSFDKEIGSVGVKPSGEAIVHVDVLANELVKHFKSLAAEGMSDQEFSDAQEADRLEKHPEKDTIKKIQALIAAQQKKEEMAPDEEDLYQHDDEYLAQLKRKKTKDESIFDTPRMGGFHNSKGVAGHMNTYSQDKAYADSNRKARKKDDETKKENATPEEEEKFHKKLDTLVHKTFGKRKEELEEDINLHKIEVSIRDAKKAQDIMYDMYDHQFEQNGSNVYLFDDEQTAYDAMMDLASRGIEIENIEDFDEEGLEEYKSDYAKRRESEKDYNPKKYRQPKNDYFARRKKEMDEEDVDNQADGDDLDVGHQDDEPDMLKQQVYDIATYAAKLYKALDKYDQYDGEVDFPNWWQSKVILARDYISAAQHYLEFEEKQPAIDALALEEGADKASYNKLKKEYDALVGKMKQLAQHFKTAEGETKAKIVAALKQHTARKRELESLIDQTVSGVGVGQELDTNLTEAKATCCGKCGRVHVKGTECKKPYLKGKDHCRYN